MLTRNEPSEIDLIHREYQRINEKWLRLHVHLTLSIALFVGALEIALYFALRYMDIVSSSRNIYFIKYFLIPTSLNLGLSLFCHLVQRSRRIPLRGKAYAVSLSLAGIGLILYSVHSVFSSLVLAVAMPIVLTTVYSDRLLTTVTALSSIAGKVLSDLLLQWDLDVVKDFSDREQLADLVLSVVVLFAIYTLCDVLIRVEQEKNNVSIRRELERQHLREQAITDPLSGTWNRQGLEQAIAELDANPTGSYALAILDLDEFKSINDTYGHLRGDKYIQELGKVLNDCGEGIPFRFGGDEFLHPFLQPFAGGRARRLPQHSARLCPFSLQPHLSPRHAEHRGRVPHPGDQRGSAAPAGRFGPLSRQSGQGQHLLLPPVISLSGAPQKRRATSIYIYTG